MIRLLRPFFLWPAAHPSLGLTRTFAHQPHHLRKPAPEIGIPAWGAHGRDQEQRPSTQQGEDGEQAEVFDEAFLRGPADTASARFLVENNDLCAATRRFCSRVGVAAPPSSPRGKIRVDKFCIAIWISRQHLFHEYHLYSLTDPLSPFQQRAFDMYEEKHAKEPLWLNIQRWSQGGAVVNNNSKKRVKAAFLEALKRNGYDKLGRALKLGTKGVKRPRIAMELFGTVRIRVFDAKLLCAQPFQELVDFFEEFIVTRVERTLCQGRERHRDLRTRPVRWDGMEREWSRRN